MQAARIEEIRIRNFKVFRAAHFRDLDGFNVLVGANGTGKTTFFDVFGFLKDCLANNVRQAIAKRGQFKEVVTRGMDGDAIAFELAFRAPIAGSNRRIRYILEIRDRAGQPVVSREVLRYTRFGGGKPYDFLRFSEGSGDAIVNERELSNTIGERREEQKLDSPDILAIKGLGQFQKFEAASAFRSLIENWHVSDFHIQAARQSRDAGFAEHLSPEGDNLPLVTQYLYERHRPVFDRILTAMARRVPGVERVEATETADGRIVLRFQDGSFKDPFISRFVSDGTIKMFAYLVLLHDPNPHPLLCIEEPENQLYPSLLGELAEEFSDYARRGGQVFVSTHSTEFLDAVPLRSIFILSKSAGVTTIKRASDDENLRALNEAGDPPGRLWRQRLLADADPP